MNHTRRRAKNIYLENISCEIVCICAPTEAGKVFSARTDEEGG